VSIRSASKPVFVAALWLGALCGVWYAGELVLLRHSRHSWFLSDQSKSAARIHDPVLGWTGRPSIHLESFGKRGAGYTANRRGFRGLQEYDDAKPPRTYRILCLGDSFTEGQGVGDRETFSFQLEGLDARLQVINMGKGAYGIDQAILRYEREAEMLQADLVVLAMIHDDLDRANWDRFQAYRPKARFVLDESGDLELVGVPVPNFWAETWNPLALFDRTGLALVLRRLYFKHWIRPDAAKLAPALFDRFRTTAAARGHEAALAYLPVAMHLRQGKTDLEQFEYRPLVRTYAERTHTPLADLTQAFLDLPDSEFSEYFLDDHGEHYSPQGHRLAAHEIARQLDIPGRLERAGLGN
jgi:SAM-dependent methyltransferase